jgi:hypothetical protein
MKKNKIPKPISILILTLMTAVVWVSLNIYRAITITPAPDVAQNVSEALNPTLNKEAITKIESSVFFQDSEIPQISIVSTETPAPQTVLPSPSPSPEATVSASPLPQ